MKTTPGDIIILHMCNKNYDQMMYGTEKVTYRGECPTQKNGNQETAFMELKTKVDIGNLKFKEIY